MRKRRKSEGRDERSGNMCKKRKREKERGGEKENIC